MEYDPSLDASAAPWEQIVLRKSRDLLTDRVQPKAAVLPNAVEQYRKRAADLFNQGSSIYGQEPDMSQFEQYARDRASQSDAAMLNALAAQYAGESFQPVQEKFLKRALAAQEPMKLAGGTLTPDGKFLRDPTAANDKRAEFLMQQARAYEQLAQTAVTDQERAEARRLHDQSMIELRRLGVDIQLINAQSLAALRNAQTNKANRGDGTQAGSFSVAGFTPQGQQVVTNTKSGISYVLTLNKDGTPNYAAYEGSMIPKATFEKEVTAASDLGSVASRADALVNQIEKSPEAFGLRSAAVAAVPGAMQGYAARAVGLTPEQLQARSTVLRQAAQEINELYGAALSMGEQARANTFLPNPSDPPEMLISKLKAARDWAKSQLGRYSPAVTEASRARSGNQPTPSPAGTPAQPNKRIRFDAQGNEMP